MSEDIAVIPPPVTIIPVTEDVAAVITAEQRIAVAETELDIAELMRDGVLPSPYEFHNITLLDIRITGTGMAFRSAVGEHVYRDPSLYLTEEFLRRCNGLPVVLDHPVDLTLDAEEFASRIAGTVMLPYIKGDEVWAVARIYSAEAIAEIIRGEFSTSPCVKPGKDTESVMVMLDNETPLLIEGKPALIDHIALVSRSQGGRGVWDKGGPASGVTLTNEGMLMDDLEKAKADAAEARAAADAAKADAEKAKADSAEWKAKCDSMTADKAKADSDAAEKAKADSEAKAKADADEKAKADAAAAEIESEKESGARADAQSRADSVFQGFGKQAPEFMAGETVQMYRRRIARTLKQHSPKYKDVDLAKADAALFKIAEDTIYADAAAAARSPADIGAGELRHITRRDRESGRTIHEFKGDPGVWMSAFTIPPKTVNGIRKDFH